MPTFVSSAEGYWVFVRVNCPDAKSLMDAAREVMSSRRPWDNSKRPL